MTITDQDVQLFRFTIKNSSEYDFSDYSDKSLKRRLAKVLADNRTDITTFIKQHETHQKYRLKTTHI